MNIVHRSVDMADKLRVFVNTEVGEFVLKFNAGVTDEEIFKEAQRIVDLKKAEEEEKRYLDQLIREAEDGGY